MSDCDEKSGISNDLIYKVYASVILHKNPDEIKSTYDLSDYFHVDVHKDGSVSYFIPMSVTSRGSYVPDEYRGVELVFDSADAIIEKRADLYHCAKEKIKGNSKIDMLFDAYMPDTLKQILGKSPDTLAAEDKYIKERQRDFCGEKMTSIAEEKEELLKRLAELDEKYDAYSKQLDSVNDANTFAKFARKPLPRRQNDNSIRQTPDTINVNGRDFFVSYM